MKRCLIVDDSDVIRKVARHFIEGLDYEVLDAETAHEALDICRRQMPDVILLDWVPPESTLPEFMTALNHTPAAKRPFVIYCTTENDAADIRRALVAGAGDCVLKPFDRQALVGTFTRNGLAA